MAREFQGTIERIDANRLRIPKDSVPGMLVDGIIYANEALADEVIGGGGAQQVANVAMLPGVVGASLAMPDIHWGYGFPIGGVAATEISAGGVISPGGVGYDINCGVRLLRSDLPADEVRPRLKELIEELFRDIPLGVGVGGPLRFSKNELARLAEDGVAYLYSKGMADEEDIAATESGGRLEGADASAISDTAYRRGSDQCGTLGAGNHFIEVQSVEKIYDTAAAEVMGLAEGNVTIMIHCGSRGLGHQVCSDYVKALRNVPTRYGITLPDRQLVCAPVESPEGQRYLAAMCGAANYAWCNRQLLANHIRQSLSRFFGTPAEKMGLRQIYDVAHNIAKIETHNVAGQEVKLCVHRKGATRAFPPGHSELPPGYADLGQPVLIPGDMGTASYILLGTDTAMRETFGSTCHGAGRILSRQAAIRSARGRRIDKELAAVGIIARARGRTGLAEEQPQAYKDIDAVVDCVTDAGLSRKVARFRPMGVIKG